MTFLGVIFGQIGAAFAARTRRASLRSVGVFSNSYLLWAIAGELAIDAVFVFVFAVSSATNGHLVFARFTAARGKSDSFDSFVLAELARTHRHRFRVLAPDSDRTKSRRCRPATPFCTTSSRPSRFYEGWLGRNLPREREAEQRGGRCGPKYCANAAGLRRPRRPPLTGGLAGQLLLPSPDSGAVVHGGTRLGLRDSR